MKFFAPKLTLLLLVLWLLAPAALTAEAAPHAVAAKETWMRLTSKNFTLIGNASEKEMRQVATRLEQFREAFSRVFTKARLDSFIPTTVVVFKDFDAYKPFNPGGHAGYFQPGEEMNYITLTAVQPQRGMEDPFSTIYHEYIHLLVSDNMMKVPVWFNEGLAEYYSTFEVLKEGKEVMLGKPISNHVLYLRDQKFLPLETLLSVDHDSPLYNERDKRGVFYAQSWALVHYLMFGKDGQRQTQLGRYLQLVASGKPSAPAFREAFGGDFEAVEKELKSYVNRNTYSTQIVTLGERLSNGVEMQAAPLSEAEAQAYLGDLLLHSNRLAEAEKYLQQALALDPKQPMAHASLGMLRVRQNRTDDARQELQQAVEGNSQNYLAHYYYAYALTRAHAGENISSGGYAPETSALIRKHLKRAIELAPSYAEPYHLHAYMSLVANNLDEATAMIQKAMQLAPGKREEYALTLAQIYLRKNDFKSARAWLEPVAQHGAEEYLRRNAAELLNSLKSIEEYEARRKEGSPPVLADPSAEATTTTETRHTTTETEVVSEHPALSNLRPRREGQEQTQGMLQQIECTAKGVWLHVRTDTGLLKFHTTNFEGIEFVSYTQELGAGGQISCGQRNPPNHVLVTYKPLADKRVRADGEVVAVDFIPKDWK